MRLTCGDAVTSQVRGVLTLTRGSEEGAADRKVETFAEGPVAH